MTLDVFIGYDHRQPVSFAVLVHSILETASQPVAIHPLVRPTLPMTREGLTPFTFSRFLTPYLMGFRGKALFLDIDTMLRGDIAELFAMDMCGKAVLVSKNKLKFEWASVMLFDCAHPSLRVLTPESVDNPETAGLHSLSFLYDEEVGDLPGEWNHLVGYDEPKDAKLVHFTQGVPAYPETKDCEYAGDWMACLKRGVSTLSWKELMGRSVHAKPVYDRLGKVA